MAEQSIEQEPTMEEILASIRRIIAEDEDESSDVAEVAELSEPDEVEEPIEVVEEAAAPEPEPEPEPEPLPEPEPEIEAELAEPEPEPAPEPAPPPVDFDEPEDEVLELTDRVEEDPVDEAEDDLVFVENTEPVQAEPAPQPIAASVDLDAMADKITDDLVGGGTQDPDLVSEPVAQAAANAFGGLLSSMMVAQQPGDGLTLENLVRELLKPMLRDWLESNIHDIVEEKVTDEVQRIANRVRR